MVKNNISASNAQCSYKILRQIVLNDFAPVLAMKYDIFMHETEILAFCSFYTEIICLKNIVFTLRVVNIHNFERNTDGVFNVLE